MTLKEVNIYAIHNRTGLSIWIMNDSQYGRDTMLMVPKQGENSYNAITNACFEVRDDEYDFSGINFKKLLSKYQEY